MVAIPLEQQLKDFKSKEDKKAFLIEKLKYYKSGPQGAIDYIKENVKYQTSNGYIPIDMWDIQEKMIYEIVDFLFDAKRDMYVILGSRQCGKTFTMLTIADYLLTLFNFYQLVLLHADEDRGINTLREFKELNANKSSLTRGKPITNTSKLLILDNKSKFRVIPTQKSSKKSDTGRGLTIPLLWIDEGAFVDLEKLETSVFPVTSQAFLTARKNNIPFGTIITSSSNGRTGIGKRFYEYWCKAEENMKDGLTSRGVVSGFRLHYSMVPDKDEEWVEREKAKYTPRGWNQEFELMFLGNTETFFSDNTIKQIQDTILNLKEKEKQPENICYIAPSTKNFNITKFKEIERNKNYYIGLDVSRGYGQDYNVIEVFEADTLQQVLECKDSKSKLKDIAYVVDYIVKELIFANKSSCLIAIEENVGFSLITDLIDIDEIYYTLVYRDTINVDYKADKDLTLVEYTKCKYGINTSSLTRPFIIDSIYRYVVEDVTRIQSIYLLSEIESLQEKDGKIQGAIHDDACFAMGMLLLVNNKGRKSVINGIFDSCQDFWNDGGKKRTIEIHVDGEDKIVSPLTKNNVFEFSQLTSLGKMPTSFQTNLNGVMSESMIETVNNMFEFTKLQRELLSDNEFIKEKETKKNDIIINIEEDDEDRMKRSDEEYTDEETEKLYEDNWGALVY